MDTTPCARLSAIYQLAVLLDMDFQCLLLAADRERVGDTRSLGSWIRGLSEGAAVLEGAEARGQMKLTAMLQLQEFIAYEAVKDREQMGSVAACEHFLLQHLWGRQRETFTCLFLNCRQQLLHCSDLFEGTVDSAVVYPREVAATALRCGATGVIVAHNHPSGVLEPSQADVGITKRLRDALAVLDIRLLDHFIIAGGGAYSMAQMGSAGFP